MKKFKTYGKKDKTDMKCSEWDNIKKEDTR